MTGGDATALDRVLRVALVVVAVVVAAALVVAALHDVSQAWDVWYYHLPFAARIVAIVPVEAYVFHPLDEARFHGYPLLGETLQGILWRATGRPECANLVALASVGAVVAFVRRRFGVPWAATFLGLVAVPLVHAHATSCYVDLPANAAAAVLVLLAIDVHASPGVRARPIGAGTIALALVAAAVAANTKVLLHPIVAIALLAIAVRAVPPMVRALGAGGVDRRRAMGTLVAIVVAAPLVFATPLKNAVLHGNPYFPVRTSILGHVLDGPEAPYDSSPAWLAAVPRPLRFAASVAELRAPPLFDAHRWSIDQWTGDPATNRLGGFFGAYAVVLVVALGVRVAVDRSRRVRAAGIGFAVLTAIVSVMPQSHELRYYMVWMIVLVALNLALAHEPVALPSRGRRVAPRALGVLAIAALAVVVATTRAAYVTPSGSGFAAFVAARAPASEIARIRDGERICVRKAPTSILWAAPFHPPRQYVVREAEEMADCAADRVVP